MKKTTSIVLVCFVIISWMPSDCVCEQELMTVQDLVDRYTIADVQVALSSSNTALQWPHIPSKTKALKMEEKTREQYEKDFQAAITLFDKMREFERTQSHNPDTENLRNLFEVYGGLGKILYRSGGYTNLLLLDSMNRCALTRLTHFLVNHPQDYEKCQPYLDRLQIPRLSLEEFRSLLSEESSIQDASEQIENIQKVGILNFVIGIEPNKPNLKNLKLMDTRTTFLLKEGDYRALLGRLIDPLRIYKIGLPGMIEYLKRGGRFEDIGMYAGNMSLFRNLMGESLQEFRLELTGDKRFGPVNLSGLIRMFKDAPYQNVFYSVAVE